MTHSHLAECLQHSAPTQMDEWNRRLLCLGERNVASGHTQDWPSKKIDCPSLSERRRRRFDSHILCDVPVEIIVRRAYICRIFAAELQPSFRQLFEEGTSVEVEELLKASFWEGFVPFPGPADHGTSYCRYILWLWNMFLFRVVFWNHVGFCRAQLIMATLAKISGWAGNSSPSLSLLSFSPFLALSRSLYLFPTTPLPRTMYRSPDLLRYQGGQVSHFGAARQTQAVLRRRRWKWR